MPLGFGESNLLDHGGVEAVKAAVKPHTLKEKRGGWSLGSGHIPQGPPNPGYSERWLPGQSRQVGEGGKHRPLGSTPARQ